MNDEEPIPSTYGELLTQRAEAAPDQPFVLFPDGTLTLGELERRANAFAHALLDLGCRKGDHVAIMLPNGAPFLIAWLATEKAGLVSIPINVAQKGQGLAYIIKHSESSTLIIDAMLRSRWASVSKDCDYVRQVIGVGGSWDGSLEMSTLLDGDNSPPWVPASAEDVTAILYTSGTTGPPKGVVHRDRTNFARHFLRRIPYSPSDCLYTFLPLFHGNAQNLTVGIAMLANARCAIDDRFTASKFWDRIAFYGATVFNYLGGVLPIIYAQPERATDADNPVRFALGAGAPRSIWQDFEQRFDLRLIEFWSTTEGGLTLNGLDGRHGSVGRPVTEYSAVRILNEFGEEVLPLEEGEISWRFTDARRRLEYFKMPEAVQERTTDEGWFRSGDLGKQDVDEYVYFIDRIKDCIRRRGENISAWEVESVVSLHPDVDEVAAVGVPSEIGEEEVKVCLRLKQGSKLDLVSFVRWCEERMAYYMVPRYVEVVSNLDKTVTQKIRKEPLRAAGVTPTTWDRDQAGIELRRQRKEHLGRVIRGDDS